MRYAVITVTDGNFLIRSEWDDKKKAIKSFLGLGSALMDDNAGFTEGYIAIIDENLDIVENYKLHLTNTVVNEPVETEE